MKNLKNLKWNKNQIINIEENILDATTDAYIKSNLCEDCTNCQYKANCHTRNSIKLYYILLLKIILTICKQKQINLIKLIKFIKKDFINLIHRYINNPDKMQKDLDIFSRIY